MDVGLAARITVLVVAIGLAFALLDLGPSGSPIGRRRAGLGARAQHRHVPTISSATVMSYVAAVMAIALGSAVALTG